MSKLAANPICPECEGKGFITYDVPPDHPLFGRAAPCHCTVDRDSERRTEDLLRASNLHELEHMTFRSFLPEGQGLPAQTSENLGRACELARDFARTPEGWLVLLGGYGCGKTHLAAAIANEQVQQGRTALLVVVPDLLDHLRAAFSPTSTTTFDVRFNELRDAPVLILDDFGAHSSTPWAQEKLYQILNYRYNSRLPTVITTNLRLEDIEPRLRSRLSDPALVTMWNIISPDYRSGADRTASDLSSLHLHADQTFATFEDRTHDELPANERENLAQARRTADSYANSPEGWLVLTGGYGCGKTHLAAAIANRSIERGGPRPMFVVVPDLLDHLRAAFSPQSDVSFDRRFESVRSAPILVLDDLGTESATPWAREKLFQLLNHRYSARLPTVITTSDAIEDLEPRLASRMVDLRYCTTIAIIAPSYRGQLKPRRRSRRR